MPKQIVSEPVSLMFPDPNQPRKHFDEAALRALGESLKIRQNEPIQIKSGGEIINGERRWRAAKLVGLEKLDAIITDETLTDTQLDVIRLTSFLHQEGLTGWEKWKACQRLQELNPGWQGKDYAKQLHIDPSMVTRLLSPSKCTPAWQEALKAGKVGLSDCYAASKLEPQEQDELLALKLNGGASRDAIKEAARRKRATTPSIKVKKVRCLLPTGVQIVVSGNGVSLDESIQSLSEAIKAMKRARELGYTAKTFAAAMKDTAMKG